MPDWKNLKVDALPKHKQAEVVLKNETNTAQTALVITRESLVQQIEIFGNMRRDEGKMVDFSIFHDRNFTWQDFNINFILDNDMQLIHFANVKPTFVGYLKSIYAQIFEVDASVNSNEQKSMVYSQSDKFKFLSSQYPHLEELKKRLGLEIEF